MRYSRVCSVLIGLVILLTTACRTGTHDQKSERIQELISDLYNKKLFNGSIVAGEKGQIIFNNGFGFSDFEDSVAFEPTTPSDGGSNAKPFTAASILLLVEEGRVKLEDPIQNYLPNYPYANTVVRNVITHSIGGLPDYDYFFERAPDTSIITNSFNLDLIVQNKPPLAYPPGTNFYYDNVGFDMGALVIEKATGMSYGEFLRKKFFDPLKMDSTFVRPSRFSDWKDRKTIGYTYQKDSPQLFDIADREGFHGGGNIWFSARDLYRWGESFYHNQILSQSVIKNITSPAMIGGKLSHLTMGAWYHGKSENAFYYWGNVAGFYSWVYWDKEKQFTIAFTTNTNMPQWVRAMLTSALIDIMEEKEYPEIKEPGSELVDRNKREQIAGTYEISNVGTAEISVNGNQVNLKVNNGMEYRMYQVDEKTFYVPGYDQWITFGDLKENKFQRLHWSSTILQADGKRVVSK